jgi:hypothetical protein
VEPIIDRFRNQRLIMARMERGTPKTSAHHSLDYGNMCDDFIGEALY